MSADSRKPDSAIVLTAGLGTRLHPATLGQAKPVLPIWNRPLLHHTLDTLKDWGVSRILLNLHHAPSTVLDCVKEYDTSGMQISYSYEADIAGTGGALRKADWFIRDSPFWLINGDILFDADPLPLIKRLKGRKTIASAWLYPHDGPCTVMQKSGKVSSFRDGTRDSGGATFAGAQVLSPGILEFLDDRPFFSIIDSYEKAMRAGHSIEAVRIEDSYWSDAGTWDSYRAAHEEIARRAAKKLHGARLYDRSNIGRIRALRQMGVSCKGLCVIPPGTQAASGTIIDNSILMEAVELKRGARVENSILCGSLPVQTPVSGINAPLARSSEPDAAYALNALAWPDKPARAQEITRPGSGRRFLRISSGRRKAVVVTYSSGRSDNLCYAEHTRFLARHGVPVPQLLLSKPKRNLLVIEDLGNRTLGDAIVGAPEKQILGLYRNVLNATHKLHQLGTLPARQLPHLEPAFDKTLYNWEHALFLDHACGVTPSLRRSVKQELKPIVQALLSSPTALIHRDLQSSNILLAGTQPRFIDYQGMRLGSAAYDLASLLADPYVLLSDKTYKRLRNDALAQWMIDPMIYDAAVIQRMLQAIGAFHRLDQAGHSQSMSGYIPPAIRKIEQSLDRLHGNFSDLRLLLSRQSTL